MPYKLSDCTILTAEDGRKIYTLPLKPSEQYQLVRTVGPDAGNAVLMSMALMAAAVRQIDDSPEPFPQSQHGIEHILDTLGDTGLAAIQKDAEAKAMDAKAAAEASGKAAEPADLVMDAAKN